MKKVMTFLIAMVSGLFLFFGVNEMASASTTKSVSIPTSLRGTFYYANGESVHIYKNSFDQGGSDRLKVVRIEKMDHGYTLLRTNNSDPLIVKKARFGLTTFGFPGYIKLYNAKNAPKPVLTMTNSNKKRSTLTYKATKGTVVRAYDAYGRLLFLNPRASGKKTVTKSSLKLRKNQQIIFVVSYYNTKSNFYGYVKK